MPNELTRTERLRTLAATPTGDLVTIDRAVLTELAERLAEAIGAIERGNNRIAAIVAERRCVAIIFATGIAPADCAASPAP